MNVDYVNDIKRLLKHFATFWGSSFQIHRSSIVRFKVIFHILCTKFSWFSLQSYWTFKLSYLSKCFTSCIITLILIESFTKIFVPFLELEKKSNYYKLKHCWWMCWLAIDFKLLLYCSSKVIKPFTVLRDIQIHVNIIHDLMWYNKVVFVMVVNISFKHVIWSMQLISWYFRH